MTRPSRILKEFANLHHHRRPPPPAPVISLARLGRKITILHRTLHSTHSVHLIHPHNSCPRAGPLTAHYTRNPHFSRQFFQSHIRSREGSFSLFGNTGPQSPNKRSRRSKQLFYALDQSESFSNPKQSSSTSWTAAAILALISGAVLYLVSPSDVGVRKSQDLSINFKNIRTTNPGSMTGETLPGRPGTLTPHEEEKLKEFWVATLHVFGVVDSKEINGNGPVRTNTNLSVKKSKKKRMNLFRSKNKDDDTASTTSTESSAHTSVGELDDKYGQTKEFHEALANLSPEALRATFWSMVKHDHPDALLLRFLRARKWDVEKALVMMVSTMRWRSQGMHVDDEIMWNGELTALDDSQESDHAKKKLGEDFLSQLRMGKSFLHGLDKEGRPMCFVRVRLHRQGEQSEESLERYTIFVIESARMILAPPVDTACVVFDMTGFSMANMDYAPVKFMIKCFEANYPESLGVVLVHKAPWIFQGIWKIIKGWLDPVVASKVHFTNGNEDMEQFVPKSQIIKELQGNEDWEYNYIEPVPGENDMMKDLETRDKLLAERKIIVDEYEEATLEWVKGNGDAAQVKTTRNDLALKLKDDYWRLDPYIRARSYYDRVGLINQGGKLQFYPGKMITPTPEVTKTEAPAAAVVAPLLATNDGQTPHVHSADDVD